MLIIEVHRCNGCGSCVQACSHGAISLVEGIAWIDSSLCVECQTCVDACPTGAIQMAMPIAQREEAEVTIREERAPVTTVSRGTLATLATATLSFMGRYLLPRVVDTLAFVLDQRLSHQSGITQTGESESYRSSFPVPRTTVTTIGKTGRGGGRRRRHRGK